MRGINRRYFFLGSFAAALSCSRVAKPSKTRVSVVRASSYSVELETVIRRILLEHGVNVIDKRVLLKPNLVEFSSHAPINTHPVFVAAVRQAFCALGARDVRIAEGPGHRRMTLDMASAAGYFTNVSGFEKIFTDLNIDEVSEIQIRQPFSTLSKLYLPHTVLGCDLLVSLAKMKTHHWTGATLSMKNLFGVVPGSIYGWPKNPLHWAGIDECVADLHYLFPRQFCLVDGIEAMEGNGPILGTSKQTGLIVAGAHLPSVDATCCQIMRIDPQKIGYLNLVRRRSGWNLRQIHQLGEQVGDVQTNFALIPELEHLRLRTAG
jgi:uncharacterized protein (DUF362 family)